MHIPPFDNANKPIVDAGDALVPLGLAALGLLLYTLFSPGLGRRTRDASV